MGFLCQLIDENDRFFSAQITEIPLEELGIALGIGFIGMQNMIPKPDYNCFKHAFL